MAETTQIKEIKPPLTNVGVIGWLRQHLFNGLLNSIATILILGFLIRVIPQFVQWAFIDSVWFSSGQECHQAAGACWSVITQNIRFNIFGYYPYEHQWRPLVAMILLVGMLIYIWIRFQLQWGFAAVAALTHDTLITLGLFSIFNQEMSLPVVASFGSRPGIS